MSTEARIRNNERHRIAYLLEQHGDTLVNYLSDPRDAVKLIAYLLRLEANRDAEREADSCSSATIDAAHIAHQREWSITTFGPGLRTEGVLDHIAKELNEIREAPTDLSEWVDVIILAFDGAQRTGADPQAIIDAIKAKQAKNEARTWPDWRSAPADKAIEHVR